MKRSKFPIALVNTGHAAHASTDTASPFASLSPIQIYVLKETKREIALLHPDSDDLPPHSDLLAYIQRVSSRLGLELGSFERDQVLSHIERDARLFGLLQPLVDDPAISDIIITNASKIAVQQGRRNYTTAVQFPSQDSYEAFVERLLQKAGASYSTKKPIADGMIE